MEEELTKSIRIAQEAHQQIKWMALKRNIPIKQLINELIEKELTKDKKKEQEELKKIYANAK